MSKLTGPCLSLSASGQIAKSIVYGVWKGIAYARQYTTPSNPKTENQMTQRGYLASALTLWHDVVNTLNTLDKTNLNRGATVIGKTMSGFNLYVRNYVLTRVKAITPNQLYGTTVSSLSAGNVTIVINSATSTISVGLRYGYSPTSMPNLVTRTETSTAGTTHTFTLTTPSAGQIIYYQICDVIVDSLVNAGIGKITVTA